MRLGHEIETMRKMYNLSIVDICNAMGITETEYRHLVLGRYHPTVYQIIMLIISTHIPLESI